MTEFEKLKEQILIYVKTGMEESKRQQLLADAQKLKINPGQLVMLIKNAELELKFSTGVSNTQYPEEGSSSGFMSDPEPRADEGKASGFVSEPPADGMAGEGQASGFISEPEPAASGFVSGPAAEGDSGFSSQSDSFSQQFTEVKKLESSGAMADIYSAIHLGRRKVIIKRIKEKYRRNQEYIDLFYKEFDTGYSLENTNIVHFYGKGDDSQGPYYYMEYVDGRTLSHLIHEEKNQNPAVITKIMLQLLDALKYMHQKQVFHRDLKPENIMVTYKGDNVKIIDFGLATDDTIVDNLRKAGTPKYSAPEALKDATQADQRSDIFSLGMILIEIFAGSPDRRKLSEIKNTVFRDIADKSTMMLPQDRYQSCDEIIRLLSSNHAAGPDVSNPMPKWLEERIKEYAADGVITRNERTVLDKEIAKAGVDKELAEAMILDECEKAIVRRRNEEARRRMASLDKQVRRETESVRSGKSVARRIFEFLVGIIVILLIVLVFIKLKESGALKIGGGEGSTSEAVSSNGEKFVAGEIVYTTANLNLRNGAYESAKVIKTCPKNTKVEVLTDGFYWVYVKAGDKRGYMARQYLSHKRSN